MCKCTHRRIDHEFSEDCSMCWIKDCRCVEFEPLPLPEAGAEMEGGKG